MIRTLSVLTLALGLAACDAGPDAARAPTPIALAAFQAGTDAFPDAGNKTAGVNFANAAVRVGVVNAIVGLNLVLPALATRAATRGTPELVDGAFVWSGTADVAGTPVDVRLTGDPRGSGVDWTMETARAGDAFFTFYTARTSLDGRDGGWRLFSPERSGAVLSADFDADGERDREITFAVPAGNEGAGSAVTYRADGDAQMFDVTKQPEGTRALIEWDVRTRAGSITADDFDGGRRACWNAALENVSC